MNIKSLSLAISALVLSSSVNAAIVSVDWQATGDNLITQVTGTGTGSGLEWLDLTATTSRSYNDISTKFGAGQEFDGWRYADAAEIAGFFDAFGGDSAYYSGWSTENNGLFDVVSVYWGDTYCVINVCGTGDGNSHFLTTELDATGGHKYGQIYDQYNATKSLNEDFVSMFIGWQDNSSTHPYIGHALVRSSVVPVPAAVWLFGSGLFGLVGVARRKSHS